MTNFETWGARVTLFAILVFMITMSVCRADGRDWTTADKVLMSSTIAVLAADMLQTQESMKIRHDDNPILEHLGPNGVVPYFVGAALLTYYAADHLSGWKRKALLGTVIVLESVCIIHNGRDNGIGISLSY